MPSSRHYDTVAFDVRDNATMLFFARTSDSGDIDDYVLLMRTIGEDFDDTIILEVNETQFAGNDLIRDVLMRENMLTIHFVGPVAEIGGSAELVLTFDQTPENKTAMEAGAFRVLGEKLAGGHA